MEKIIHAARSNIYRAVYYLKHGGKNALLTHSLDVNTICVENKLVLSLLSTKSWLGSDEGGGGQ